MVYIINALVLINVHTPVGFNKIWKSVSFVKDVLFELLEEGVRFSRMDKIILVI